MSSEFTSKKQGLVKLVGVSLARGKNILERNYLICRIKNNKNSFTVPGLLNKKLCCFTLDTSSDVLLVSDRPVRPAGNRKIKGRPALKYPTGEEMFVCCKCVVLVELGEYFLEIPMYLVKMREDCILGIDFF